MFSHVFIVFSCFGWQKHWNSFTYDAEHGLIKLLMISDNFLRFVLLRMSSFPSGPREFVVKLDSLDCEEDGFGGLAAVPVNMYKLCSEVVIPATICAEKICRVIQSEDLTKLAASFASENDFTLLQGPSFFFFRGIPIAFHFQILPKHLGFWNQKPFKTQVSS